MISNELKPCPFCQDGGELFINGGVGCRWVECSSCGCDGPAYETEAEAIEAWNTRAELTCHNTADGDSFFRCSECGCCVLTEDEQGQTIWRDRKPLGVSYCPNCGAKVVK